MSTRPESAPDDALFPLGATTARDGLARLAERFPLPEDRDALLDALLVTVQPGDDPSIAAAMNGLLDMLVEATHQLNECRAIAADLIGQIREITGTD